MIMGTNLYQEKVDKNFLVQIFWRQILKRVWARSDSADGLVSPAQLKQETIRSCDLFNTTMERAQRTGASVYRHASLPRPPHLSAFFLPLVTP